MSIDHIDNSLFLSLECLGDKRRSNVIDN